MEKTIASIVIFITVITMRVNGQVQLTYTEVIPVDSISKNELYNSAKLWFTTVYNSAKDVLQMDNKDEGQIIGKAIIRYYPKVFVGSETTKGNINYIIKVFVKDGRYKYEITDFVHHPDAGGSGRNSGNFGLITTDNEYPNAKSAQNWYNKVWSDIKNQIEQNILPLIVSLKEGMNKPSETKKDNW